MTTKASERRAQARTVNDDRWQTSLTAIEPNKIQVRGYSLDEMMGRLGFAEAVYLLLMGELPTPAIGRMLNAVLVSSIDHGVTPWSSDDTSTAFSIRPMAGVGSSPISRR